MFPLQLFLILEKTSCKMWINKTLEYNNFNLFISQKWFINIIQILKCELFASYSTLIEHTIVDMSNQKSDYLGINLFNSINRFMFNYNIYIHNMKVRLIFFLLNDNSKNYTLNSIDSYYSNANWLERESSEMYGIFFYLKRDLRKLLLDYSKLENPMLKDFPSEGLNDVFFNFFYNQIYINKNEVVEL